MSKFGLIGFPAAESLSPALFQAAYGGRWPYEIIEEEDFGKAFGRFLEGDFRAVNVTAPHKKSAADVADRRSAEVERIGAANILVKSGDGLIEAYNSDTLAVRLLVGDFPDVSTALVIGLGGAGRAALDACLQCGYKTSFLHHDEPLTVTADLIVFTLPKAVPGIENLNCRYLLEANYLSPCCSELPGVDHYIGGHQWLLAQAVTGYSLMTGEDPDAEAMTAAI